MYYREFPKNLIDATRNPSRFPREKRTKAAKGILVSLILSILPKNEDNLIRPKKVKMIINVLFINSVVGPFSFLPILSPLDRIAIISTPLISASLYYFTL